MPLGEAGAPVSLVVRAQGVAGSNPVSPTSFRPRDSREIGGPLPSRLAARRSPPLAGGPGVRWLLPADLQPCRQRATIAGRPTPDGYSKSDRISRSTSTVSSITRCNCSMSPYPPLLLRITNSPRSAGAIRMALKIRACGSYRRRRVYRPSPLRDRATEQLRGPRATDGASATVHLLLNPLAANLQQEICSYQPKAASANVYRPLGFRWLQGFA